MKIGDLVRVKGVAAYGNAYMQNIAGCTGIVVELRTFHLPSDRAIVMLCNSMLTEWLMSRDLEVVNER